MGKRGIPPQKQVSTEWTPLLAYAVGLITTDGCLSKDGRHIDFTSKDKDLVLSFRKCLGLKNKVGLKTSGSAEHKDYFRIQFGDINFYRWLRKIGLSPNKSRTLGPLRISNEFFFDFLRGCFDGDGTIHAFWDLRWRSSYVLYIKFASASPPYLKWLQRKIYALSGIIGNIQIASRSYQLVYAKRNSYILFEKMFYTKNIPYLRRKHKKAMRIFKTDKEHTGMRPGGGIGLRNRLRAYASIRGWGFESPPGHTSGRLGRPKFKI